MVRTELGIGYKIYNNLQRVPHTGKLVFLTWSWLGCHLLLDEERCGGNGQGTLQESKHSLENGRAWQDSDRDRDSGVQTPGGGTMRSAGWRRVGVNPSRDLRRRRRRRRARERSGVG